MKRYAVPLLLTLALVLSLTGCNTLQSRMAAANEPPISPQLQVPDLLALRERGQLTIAQLGDGLRKYINSSNEPVADKLSYLYEHHWQLEPVEEDTPLWLEADLDGDGVSEIITVLNDASSVVGSGQLFVIYRDGEHWNLDVSPEIVLGASLHAVTDLTGDGKPEIVWSSTSAGANTPTLSLFVSTWEPGQIANLPGKIVSTYAQLEIDGSDILVQGGLFGGWGAGRVQRQRTDRYRFLESKLKLVDQTFAPSNYSYHRLIDGILAESWQHLADARSAYTDAMNPNRDVLFTEDTVPPEWQARFNAAVRTLARFRLALLELKTGNTTAAHQLAAAASGSYTGLLATVSGTSDAKQAALAAVSWAEANPEFVQALSSPRGWANPEWTADNLTGPLPLHLEQQK